MHAVDLLEEALSLAERHGFEIRQEWLTDSAGGACRIGKREILYVNLSLTADEQLQQVVRALRAGGNTLAGSQISAQLQQLLCLDSADG